MKCPECQKPLSLCGCDPATPQLEAPFKILVLQHPQEKREVLSTVPFLKRRISNLTLRRGLSTPNLIKASGILDARPNEWVVFYLGGKNSLAPSNSSPIEFLKPKGKAPEKITGLIFLDGTWAQAKTLWWRNPWLLKCSRAVLRPSRPSLYGNLRREPRRECLSTLESVGLAVETLSKDPSLNQTLCQELDHFLTAYRNEVKPYVHPNHSRHTS